MNDFDPKHLFQTSRKELADTLAEQATAPWMRTALVYTLSHMALSGASAEELRGAKTFIVTFMNLSEKPPEPQTYPAKPLEHH